MSLRTLGMSVAAVLALAGCGPGAPGGEDPSRLETPAVADAPEASPSSTAPLTGASAPDRFTAIGAGGTHTCAMDDSGRVWCWGWDESGQLGRGEPSDGPTVVVGEHEFTEIRAGDGFTCALDRTGKAWCWGLDHHGQLGDGDPVGGQADAPLLVAGARDFSSVAAGGGEGGGAGHACALDGDGHAWCWGSDDYGQIGDGARSNGDHAAPVLVAGERRFRPCPPTASSRAPWIVSTGRGVGGPLTTRSPTTGLTARSATCPNVFPAATISPRSRLLGWAPALWTARAGHGAGGEPVRPTW